MASRSWRETYLWSTGTIRRGRRILATCDGDRRDDVRPRSRSRLAARQLCDLAEGSRPQRAGITAARTRDPLPYGGRSDDGAGCRAREPGRAVKRARQGRSRREQLLRAVSVLDREVTTPDPRVATAHSHLGQVMWSLGELEQARREMQRAVEGYAAALGATSADTLTAQSLLDGMNAPGAIPTPTILREVITPESIARDEGRLLAAEPAYLDDAERLLRSAADHGDDQALFELALLLEGLPGNETEAHELMQRAVAAGVPAALYREGRRLLSTCADRKLRRSASSGWRSRRGRSTRITTWDSSSRAILRAVAMRRRRTAPLSTPGMRRRGTTLRYYSSSGRDARPRARSSSAKPAVADRRAGSTISEKFYRAARPRARGDRGLYRGHRRRLHEIPGRPSHRPRRDRPPR